MENKEMKLDPSEYGGYPSPRLSSELPDCSMPMTFDHQNFCCPPGTTVSTPKGQTPIEYLLVGDEVVVRDGVSTITQVMNRDYRGDIIIIDVDGGTLELTPEHPVMVNGKGWVLAGDLKEADEIIWLEMSSHGKITTKKILSIRRRSYAGVVYNISVQNDEHYFANKILVHNCAMGCIYCAPAGTQIRMANGRKKSIERVREGEHILSFNIETNKPEMAKVTATMRRKEARKLFVIHTERGEGPPLTGEHPVFTKRGWVEVKDVTGNDEVLIW